MESIKIILLLLFLWSCQNAKVTTLEDSPVIKNESVTNHNEDFQSFWNNFRTAILDRDSIRLTKMVNFPLKVHGDEDNDPQLDIFKDTFYNTFQKYLNRETVVYQGKFERNLDFIIRTTDVKKSGEYLIDSDSWQRIGDMEFKKINEGWKLTLIYLDTKNRGTGK